MSANDRDAHWADQPTEDLPIFPPGSASSTRAGNDNFSSGPAGKTPLTAPGSASETHADLTSYTDWSRGVPTGHTQGTSGATQFFESPGRAGYQDLGPDIRHDEQETEDLPPLDEIYAAQRGGHSAGRDRNVGGPAYVGGAHTGGGYQSGQGNTGVTPPTTDANPHAATTTPYGTYAEATEVLGGTAPGTPAPTRNADYVDPTPSGAINTGHFQPVDATEVVAAPPVAHPGGPDAAQVLGGEYAPTQPPTPGSQSPDATQVLGAPVPASTPTPTPAPGSQSPDATQVMPVPGSGPSTMGGPAPSPTTTAELPADANPPSTKKKKRRKKANTSEQPAPTSPPPNTGPPLPRAEYARRLRQRVFGAFLWAVLAWGLGRVALTTVWGQSLDTLAMEAMSRFSDTFRVQITSVTEFVSPLAIIGMAAVIVLITLARRRPTLAGRALGVILGANITVQIAKIFLVRPDLGVTTALGNSLPSGHVTVAISLCLALVIVAPEWGRGPAAWLAWIVSSLMGIVVMSLSWHRLADVLVSVLITGAWAMVLTPLESRVRHGVVQKKLMSWVAGACLVLAVAVTLIAVLGVDPMAVSTPGDSGYGFSEFLESEPIRARMLAMAAGLWVIAVNGSVVTSVDRLSRR